MQLYNKHFYELHIALCAIVLPLIIAQSKKFEAQTLSLKVKYFLQKKQENVIMAEKNNKISALNTQITLLKQENNLIKKYNYLYDSFKEKYSYNIKYISDNFYVINSASEKSITMIATNKKIKKNSLVVDENNILIGRVVENNKRFIKVQLLSDKQSNIPAYAGNSDGIISGTNNEKCKIIFSNLSTNKPNNGDIVITSGFEDMTLKGVIIGTIKKNNNMFCVENNSINNFKTAIII